jgi:translation elongation factor EF-4
VRTPAEEVLPNGLTTGEVGYLVAGIKDVMDARVGDTITAGE